MDLYNILIEKSQSLFHDEQQGKYNSGFAGQEPYQRSGNGLLMVREIHQEREGLPQ